MQIPSFLLFLFYFSNTQIKALAQTFIPMDHKAGNTLILTGYRHPGFAETKAVELARRGSPGPVILCSPTDPELVGPIADRQLYAFDELVNWLHRHKHLVSDTSVTLTVILNLSRFSRLVIPSYDPLFAELVVSSRLYNNHLILFATHIHPIEPRFLRGVDSVYLFGVLRQRCCAKTTTLLLKRATGRTVRLGKEPIKWLQRPHAALRLDMQQLYNGGKQTATREHFIIQHSFRVQQLVIRLRCRVYIFLWLCCSLLPNLAGVVMRFLPPFVPYPFIPFRTGGTSE